MTVNNYSDTTNTTNVTGSYDNSSSSTTTPSTWKEWKQQATKQFQDGNYDGALYSYTQALRVDLNNNNNNSSSSSHTTMSLTDRQFLLSNIVACRLKLGGRIQAAAAVETAKQCIDINPNWAKGHVRLASALIATGDPTKSNDACRSLQRALQLDPHNPVARDMLVKELRRDHRDRYHNNNNNNTNTTTDSQNDDHRNRETTTTTESSDTSSSHHPTPAGYPSAPPQHMDDRSYDDDNVHNHYGSTTTTSSSSSPSSSFFNDVHDGGRGGQRRHPFQDDMDIDIDDTETNNNNHNLWTTCYTKIQLYMNHAKQWYMSQSDDVQTLLKILFVLVCLYVAFGGRFGLEYLGNSGSSTSSRHTSSTSNNRYYGDSSSQRQSAYTTGTNTGNSRRTTTAGNYEKGNAYDEFYRDRDRHRYQQQHDDDRYYDPYSNRRRERRQNNNGGYGYNSYYGGNTGGVPNLLILAGVAYVAHRNGMNPLQALFYANVAMNGGRGGGFGVRRRMFGGGFGGMGGFGRPRPGHHHRPGGMWGW